ncbi:hypothetical protein [Flavobacterium sp.]|uniref:hypothetical protein n=1 Tax=Flavobacterium sp. TaxID=239 RepID=UPI0026229936|nr:hypothetical protein [Flavobacterium sp.]
MKLSQILSLSLIFSYNLYSQSKAIVPTKGTIAFEKSEKITDSLLYKKSISELNIKMKDALKKTVLKEREEMGELADSTLIDEIINMEGIISFEDFLFQKKDKLTFNHEYNNKEISYYVTIDEKILNSFKTINITNIKETIDKKNSSQIATEDFGDSPFLYSKIEILNISEFPKLIRKIEGYNCFKVILTYKSNENKSDFDFFINDYKQYKELWVTKEIKTPFHPVVKEKELLEKYYPLEIIEYSDEIKGMKTIYTLKKLSLQ